MNTNYDGKQNDNLEKLQNLNYSFYQSVKIKDYSRSKNILEEITQVYLNTQLNSITTVEGIEAITSSIKGTKQLLSNKESNHNDIIYSVTQLHLAIDTLTHKEQPLWHRYYSVVEQDITEIRKTINDSDNNRTEEYIRTFQDHFNLIKPAILVSEQAYLVENIDSLITALIKQNISPNKDMILNQLQSSIHQIFYGSEYDTMGGITIKSFLWKASLLVGLIIFLVLSYVIWRKIKK
ncbi:MAG: sporulation protein YpjB [Vulcanibacillus sp.]